jgi:hypothetical protein
MARDDITNFFHRLDSPAVLRARAACCDDESGGQLMDNSGSEERSPFVTIRRFTSDAEANIARSALKAFGIDAMISTDSSSGQRFAFTQGIRLEVRRDDIDRAEDVLNRKAH